MKAVGILVFLWLVLANGEPQRIKGLRGQRACNNEQFKCNDGSCIAQWRRCDYIQDCAESEDEINCQKCRPGTDFQCGDGTCLPIDLKCDGNPDCADRSDEKDCQCKRSEWTCSDGSCIESEQHCDQIFQCADKSDELNCPAAATCAPDQFRCGDGSCIPSTSRCDRIRDCSNGEDETSCSCASDDFRCRSGQCVSRIAVCDGYDDCFDASDERNCSCSSNEFRCSDGTCIDSRSRCDGTANCNDGSDEIDCQAQDCTADQFRCGNGVCISPEWKCDGVPDCNDSADEIGCTCLPNEFQCASSGECIDPSLACDGKDDCRDKSDEKSCPCGPDEYTCKEGGCVKKDQLCNGIPECTDASDEDPQLCTKCASYEFECSSGQCIYATQRCNGEPECLDRSDEIGCPEVDSCGSYEFQCRSGECISQSAVCDGRNDCLDNSDEALCSDSSSKGPCDNREFTCGDGTCISLFSRCDFRNDCIDGSDEVDCQGFCDANDFRCTDGQCVPKSVVCDRRRDCLDGSDEQECPSAPPTTTCQSNEFSCLDGQQCIQSDRRCDQRYDCSDRSDEQDCPPVPCYPDQFTCRTGDCIPASARCNNNYECPDGSDEQDCPPPDASGGTEGECRPDQFACANGDCIRLSQRCNNNYDCADGTDEYGCTATPTTTTTAPSTTTTPRICRLDEFTCDNGDCVALSLRCNNNYECRDGSDEFNCATPPPPTRCSASEFQCRDGAQCIEQPRHCDGRYDCFDRSDEQDCPAVTCRPDEFTCQSGDCVASNLRCDRNYDCPDGSDETDCTSSTLCNPDSEFACKDGRQCIPRSQQCNDDYDCRDYSDEQNCQETFTCASGERISAQLKCDGRPDCPDGSDENRCAGACRDGEFQCHRGGQCISDRRVCDGAYDCRDRSDEERCDTRPDRPVEPRVTINLVTIPANQTIEQGRQVVFRCRDEGSSRAPVRWVRQGHNRLPPKSTDVRGRLTIDEVEVSASGDYFCEAQGLPLNTPGRRMRVTLLIIPFVKPTIASPLACAYNETTCRSGQCLPKSAVCDGKYDCDDQSDEDRCNLKGCEPNEFKCDNNRCVQKSWICDSEDDCLDGSDERNCAPPKPGSDCQSYEFTCQTNNQCVPKSFVCDNEMDCQDGSDEFGCGKPIIVDPPKRTVNVDVGNSFTLTCRAVGMPVPEIVWRLNWGHVPSACVQTSDEGYGTITCTNVELNYQGAYSCEAINALGPTFAVPDSIVTIKGGAGAGVCLAPRFNAAAATERDCLNCFCFRVTSECASTDQNRVKSPPPSGAFEIIGVNQDNIRGNFVVRQNEYRISSSYVRTTSVNTHEIYIPDRSSLGAPNDLLLFFSLPSSHRGNLLGSYGGYLRYQMYYRKSGPDILGPQLILKGNNMTLMRLHDDLLTPNAPNSVSIRFWPGEWYKRVMSRGGDIEALDPATREDIMTVLQNVELFLIRASYNDGILLQTTLSDVELDTVSYSLSQQGQAVEVESCRCPPGYTGLSCETCAPNYRRIQDGSALGRCVLNISCGPTEFGDPANGIPCQLCPCPLTNPANQFSQSCYLDADSQVTCNCATGYVGRRCQTCAAGYTGNPGIPGDSCRPAGECDRHGSLSTQPDPNSGLCQCKELTVGAKCSQCQQSAFYLNENSKRGCIECFCMGVSSNCTSSNGYRTQEVVGFVGDTQGFLLVDQYQVNTIQSNLYVDSGRQELIYRAFQQLSPDVYYWKLPRKFVKDKVSSYGGNLTYSLRYVPLPGGQSSRNNAYDVEIFGNDVTLRYFSRDQQVNPSVIETISVPFYEQYWQRQDGQEASRENFMMALADLEYILIKATYTTSTNEVGLKEVRMDYASPRNTGGERAFAVESCECPPGHKGLSCEDCDAGYTRDFSALYLGRCIACDCNRHSEECDPDSGVCFNCRNNRAGDYCEECAPGFEQDYSGYCVRRDECTCDVRGSLSAQCENERCLCKSNVEGDECKTCRPGFFHLSEDNPAGCQQCWCSGVTDKCTSSYLNREQIPMNLFDTHNFTLTNRLRTNSMSELAVDIAQNMLTFDNFEELSSRETYYWSLPQIFTGNKLGSYGGKLSLKQKFDSRSSSDVFSDADIIIIGSNQKEFVWMNKMETGTNSQEKDISIRLLEDNFSYNQSPARREDFLAALASIEAILVRASFSNSITSTSLRDVVMDTAVDYSSGQTRALEVEQCSCPSGHVGNSCEDCAQGYYKDFNNRCQRCRCGGKEQSCSLVRDRGLICNCLPGYSGEQCEISGRPDLSPVAVFEVRISQAEYTVESGSTIELLCSVSTPVAYQMTIAWDREDGPLPLRRVIDNRLGSLTITQVRPDDSGTYICRASTGVQVKEARTVLRVTGGPPPSKPIVIIDEQREEIYVRIGEYIRVRCRARGSPPPQVQWYRQDGRQLSYAVSQTNGLLTFNNPQRPDSGVYICLGSNREGSSQAIITINVSEETAPPPPSGNYIIVQVPENIEAQPGSSVRITCRVPASFLVSTYEWSRMQNPLPEKARQIQADLVISDAQPADSGMYTCTVRDNQGRSGKATTDVVIATYGNAPEVRIEPDRQTIHQGTNAELKCTATGNPKPVITWSKDNEQFSRNVQVQGDTLKIVNAQVSDRGLYRCTAKNTAGEGRSVAVLEVELREPPVIEIYPEIRTTIKKGESASFLCHLTKGYPTPSLSWARTDGSQITQNTEILNGGVIKFNQVTGTEEGTYVCTATNDAGRMTAMATLEIEAIPVVFLNPATRSMTVKEGERIRIECSAEGDPAPGITWQKLQVNYPQDIPASSTTSRLSVYEVTSAKREDQGVYQCTAANSAGTTVERIQIIVEQTLPAYPRPPYPQETRPDAPPTAPPSDTDRRFQVPLGGQFEFRCVIDGLESDTALYTYEFRRSDGRPLPREHILGARTLTVSNVDRNAQGEYACIIKERTTLQAIITIYANLDIVDPPRITLEPARQVVRPGDNANLRCAVTGDQPITITWSKQTGPMPPSVIINGGLMMFRGIQVTDAGKYLCEAVNPVGRAEAVAEVIVNERPLLTSLQQYVTLAEGQDGELRCTASGLPASAVQWSREGSDLPNNFRASGTVLRIYKASTVNSGQYKCEARTPSGDYTFDYVDLNVQRSRSVDIQIRASKESVALGDTVDLFCDVTGDPRAYVTWKRIQGPLPRNARVDANRLRISKVDQSNGGVYVCSVTTATGMFDKEYPLPIQNTFSATRSVDTRSIQFGSTVVLKCGAQVAPPISFTWSKQNGQLPVRARIQDATLEIPEVQADDAGTYVCTASNGQDSNDSPTLLIVTGVVPSFSGNSHLALSTLPDAYLFFDLEISFKPDSNDGMIIYNSQKLTTPGDFISFGLSDGFAEFRFDVGSGPAILRSRQQLSLGEWHTVKLTRNRKEGTMSVDGGTAVTGKSVGRFQGLDLINPLYLGGVPDFAEVNTESGFRTGFVGCISQLVVGVVSTELMRDVKSQQGVVPCDTCSRNPCHNAGVCQEAYAPTGHKCICPAGYSGISCESTGQSCYPGVCGAGRCINQLEGFECYCPFGTTGSRCEIPINITEPALSKGSYLAYRTPRAVKRFAIGMKIKPDSLEDGLIMYCSQQEKGDGDFTSLAIRDGRLEFKFNTGTGTAMLHSENIVPGEWIKVHANRTDQVGSLSVNGGPMQNAESPGTSRSLNLRTHLYVGGVDRSRIEVSPDVQVSDGFSGCISEIEVMDQPIRIGQALLDSANVDQCGVLPCTRDPCGNGGTCHSDPRNPMQYDCECTPGFSGTHCDVADGLCARSQPCLNNAVCKDTANDRFECQCSLGFSGDLCQHDAYLTDTASFNGQSWIEVDRYLVPQDGIGEQEFNLGFSTSSPDGLLLWLGQEPTVDGRNKDFLSLAVVDGYPVLRFGMGGEQVTVRGSARVDDGNQHTVFARKLRNEASLVVDSEAPIVERGSDTLFSFNTFGNIFIGGTPSLEKMTSGQHNAGFAGCIHHMRIGTSTIDSIMDYALAGVNVTPCPREETQQSIDLPTE